MTMKVHELAKEMNTTSKELLEKINKLGIDVKSHMSVLSDADIEKIRGGKKEETDINKEKKNVVTSSKPKPPIGKPVVSEEYFANKKKPPVGKPVVNEDYFANKSKNNEERPAVVTEKETEPKPKTIIKTEKDDKKIDSKTVEPYREPRLRGPKVIKTAAQQEIEKAEFEAKREEARKAAEAKKRSDKPIRTNHRNDNGQGKSDDRTPRRTGDGNVTRSGDRNDRNNYRTGDRTATRNGERTDRPNFRNDRNDRTGLRNDRNNDRPAGRSNDNRVKPGERKPVPDKPSADSIIKPDHSKRSENKNNHEKYDKGRNKFAKLEKRSLEKQTKKKHVKAKPVVIEPEIEQEPLPEGTVVLTVPITVAGFCEQTDVSTSRVIMSLMKMGIMANINQSIDEDMVMILAEEIGINVVVGHVEKEIEEEGLELFEDEEKDLSSRPPIITVMGHVDHGKTSLLDAIRKTNVTASESGGITQHIGASEVKINGQKIVFLDTPGHEAFTAMRARGAHATDIAVLVVAADDSVKPQTIESISHAKAAGVPIIVAINKMDKPGANPDRVKQDLTEHGILVEDWGGDVISVPVSAKSGDGIVTLLEMILLQAEVMELKANPNRFAMGSVIEARLDKAKGPVATLLVTNGTLESGQSIVVGTCSGKIRLMTDHNGKIIKKAGPATAVEILGLTEVPQAGDEFNAVKEDKAAREIAEHRKEKLREEVLARNASTTLEQLFSQIQEGEIKELNLIIKGDVQGSVGALVSSLEKLNNENVKVNIIHTGVGTITESDIMLAGTTRSIVIGFNVRPSTAVTTMASRDNVQIRTYRVIYDVIDDIENAMTGMLDPEFKEEILGKVQIRTTFKVPGIGIIGGAYVTEGKVVRNAQVRLVRDGIVIHEGTISSLKRFKDDAKEVATGYECGIGIENYNDIKEEDIIECFHMVEIERK